MAVCVLPVIYFVRRKRQPWLSLGLKQQMFTGGLQVGFALLLVTIFLRGKLSPLIYGDKNINQLYLLIACLVAAFGEEIIFRGYLQPRLENWLGDLRGYGLTAILSAVWVILPLIGIAWIALAALFIYRLLLSLLLGWVLKRSGSILPGWIYHTIHMWLFWI
jgi:membrane protease YdiL (CAAX protease family)